MSKAAYPIIVGYSLIERLGLARHKVRSVLLATVISLLLIPTQAGMASSQGDSNKELSLNRKIFDKKRLVEAKSKLAEITFLAQPTVFDEAANGYLVFDASLEVIGRHKSLRIPEPLVDVFSAEGSYRIGTIGGQCEFPFLGMSACSQMRSYWIRKSVLASRTIEVPGFRFDFHDLKFVESRGSYFGLGYTLKSCSESPTLCTPSDEFFADCEVSEVSVATGKELRRWSASNHLSGKDVNWEKWINGLGGPDLPPTFDPSGLYSDPFHCNSLDFVALSGKDGLGQLMLSMRHTDSLYGINWPSGEIVWKLGGRPSSLRLNDCTSNVRRSQNLFGGQHDARFVVPSNRPPTAGNLDISVLDNGNNTSRGGRALLLQIVQNSNCFKIKTVFRDPYKAKSYCTGSFRILDSGYGLAGWGCSTSGITLFAPNGDPIVSSSVDATKSDWALVSPFPALRTQISYRVLPIGQSLLKELLLTPTSK